MDVARLSVLLWIVLVLTDGGLSPALAQPTVEATVNATEIGTQERLVLTLTIEGAEYEQMDIPDVPETRGLAPQQRFPSTSSEIRIVNGDISRILRYSWVYHPVKAGIAVIEPIHIEIGDYRTRTDPIRITVVDQAQRRKEGITSAGDSAFSDDDIFIRAVAEKRRAFVNEQIVIEYKLYFREGIQLRQSRLAGSWDAPGFWREELEVDLRPIPDREIVNGLPYQTIVLKRVAMFPTRSGRLSIHPLKIETEARPRHGTDLLDAFFAYRNRFRNLELQSPEVAIDVRPLPENPPQSFTGAVGQFEVRSRTTPSPVRPGDPVSRQIEISGTGNIPMITPPPAPDIRGFELIAPRTAETVDRGGDAYRGRKSFDYVLIPQESGTHTLTPLSFSYFDPKSEMYREFESPEILVEVLPSDLRNDRLDHAGTGSNGVLTTATWTHPSPPLHRQPWAYAPGAAALLAWLIIPAIRRSRGRRQVAAAADASRKVVLSWKERLDKITRIQDQGKAFREARALLVDMIRPGGERDRASSVSLLSELRQREDSALNAALRNSVLIVEEARFHPPGSDAEHRVLQRLLSSLSIAIRESLRSSD